jgi:hypothetical protein
VYDAPSVPVALENTINHAQSNTIRSLDVPELILINQPITDKPQLVKSDSGGRSSEQVIGRIFAWGCATLYFTARLPQIWKNVGFKFVQAHL